MNEGKEGIKMAIGLIILLLVASLGFILYNIGKTSANNAMEKVDELNVMLDESRYTDYEGRSVSGNVVQSLVNKYKNDTVFVKVETKTNTTWYNYSNESLTSKVESSVNNENVVNSTIKGEENYINPNAKFTCTLYRDANDTIMGVIFEQE